MTIEEEVLKRIKRKNITKKLQKKIIDRIFNLSPGEKLFDSEGNEIFRAPVDPDNRMGGTTRGPKLPVDLPKDIDPGMGSNVRRGKEGGLMEATAKLKAKGFSEGGAVVKDKTVAIDKSPNSGLITQRGFGASRKT